MLFHFIWDRHKHHNSPQNVELCVLSKKKKDTKVEKIYTYEHLAPTYKERIRINPVPSSRPRREVRIEERRPHLVKQDKTQVQIKKRKIYIGPVPKKARQVSMKI